MTDNFNLLYDDEKNSYYSITHHYFKYESKKCFLRFLKDRDLFNEFKNLFYSYDRGVLYREYLYSNIASVKKLENDTIGCFFSSYASHEYLLNAFVWDDKDFWHNVNKEWIDYLVKNFNKR